MVREKGNRRDSIRDRRGAAAIAATARVWHVRIMSETVAPSPSLHHSLVHSLYADALVLADEARGWFDRARAEGEMQWPVVRPDDADSILNWPGRTDASARIALSCESLRLTTRLMHVIAWLLMQRAVAVGEVDAATALMPDNRLGEAPRYDADAIATLPAPAQRLIEASVRLHERVAALEASLLEPAAPVGSGVHAMMGRLQSAY
jgi:regulator of CtrA degradation